MIYRSGIYKGRNGRASLDPGRQCYPEQGTPMEDATGDEDSRIRKNGSGS